MVISGYSGGYLGRAVRCSAENKTSRAEKKTVTSLLAMREGGAGCKLESEQDEDRNAKRHAQR
eukprot:scaffold10585_cov32-Tisochrysis_lutea.AAC.4